MALKVRWIVLVLAVVATSTQGQYLDKFQALRKFLRQSFGSVTMKQDNDHGVVKHCQGTPGPPFSVQWEPKVISPDGGIKVHYDYTIPHDFKSGTLNVELFFRDKEDPIFQDTLPVDCSKIGKYVKCPLQQGKRLKGEYPYSNLRFLKGFDGTYMGILKLTDAKGEMMACANLTATISSNDVY